VARTGEGKGPSIKILTEKPRSRPSCLKFGSKKGHRSTRWAIRKKRRKPERGKRWAVVAATWRPRAGLKDESERVKTKASRKKISDVLVRRHAPRDKEKLGGTPPTKKSRKPDGRGRHSKRAEKRRPQGVKKKMEK